MKLKVKAQKLIGYLVIPTIIFMLGGLAGIALSSQLKINNTISGDGLLTSAVTLVAIIAATFLLPLRIQPLIQKQTNLVSRVNNDIDTLLRYIDELLAEYTQLYESKKVMTLVQRKSVLNKYTQLVNRADIVKKQSNKVGALVNFDEEVSQKLRDGNIDIAGNVLPKHKLSENTYLSNKSVLETIANKLHEIRYELS